MNNCRTTLHPTAAAEFILSIFPFHIIQRIAAFSSGTEHVPERLIKIRNQLVFKPLLQTEAPYLHFSGGRVLKCPFYLSVLLPSGLWCFQLGLDLLTL